MFLCFITSFLSATTDLSTEITGEVSDGMSVQIGFALKLFSAVKTGLLFHLFVFVTLTMG